MSRFQGTIFMQQQGYGWTESYFSDYFASYNPALIALRALIQKRALCSGSNTNFKYLRISDVALFRDVLGEAIVGLNGSGGGFSDAPATALLVKMNGLAQSPSKITYMRGIPDAIVTQGGLYQPDAAFLAGLDAFKAKLLQGQWGWMGSLPQAPAFIGTCTQNANGTWTVVTQTDIFAGPFPRVVKVRIAGILGAPALRGTRNMTATGVRTSTTVTPVYTSAYAGGGTITASAKQLIKIIDLEGQRIIERRPGRPSYLSRGRRAARRVA